VAPTPNIVVPSSLSFARVSTGTVTQSILRITNNGTAALNVTNVQITDSGTGVFSVITNGCLGASLAPGAGCDVTLQFAPALSGSYIGRVTVTSNDPDQAVVNVSLSGSTAKSAGGSGSKKGGPRK
jgi:hypothetical protein